MQTTKQIAENYRQVYFGGNWTSVNIKDTLNNITWQQATTQIKNCNTIATLVYHINYYVMPIYNVLKGHRLDASDSLSFAVPAITNQLEWQQLIVKSLNEAEQLATQIELFEDSILYVDFADAKFGNYFRNLVGNLEHTHYHLGQIAILKKLL